jgi:hypothetical protein
MEVPLCLNSGANDMLILEKCMGVGQNNGNATETIHISTLIWCWTTFCL